MRSSRSEERGIAGSVIFGRRVLLALGCFLAGCAGGGSSLVRQTATPAILPGTENVFQLGDLYFAGQPEPGSWVALQSAGIRSVLDLRDPSETPEPERDSVKAAGLQYIKIPVTPDSFSRNVVEQFSVILVGMERPLLIHCSSANRAGGLWAAHLAIHEGVPIEEAIRHGEQAGLRKESMKEAVRRVVRE